MDLLLIEEVIQTACAHTAVQGNPHLDAEKGEIHLPRRDRWWFMVAPIGNKYSCFLKALPYRVVAGPTTLFNLLHYHYQHI